MSTREEQIHSLCDAKAYQKAFRLIVDTYSEELYWVVRQRVGVHEDADDVLQEVFVLIWKNLQKFRWESKFRSWAYRIAINQSYSFLRSKKNRQTQSLDAEDNFELEGLKSDSWFDGDEAVLKLEAAIRSLPEKQRQVFELRYYQEMSYDDMHELLGTSTGGLKASYHHAQTKIKKYLSDD